MRVKHVSVLIFVALIATTVPLAASAGVSLGANVGSARVNGGDFQGSDTGWKAHIGSSFTENFGGEIGYVDFGHLGGNGPSAYAWTPALMLGIPLGTASIYGKGGVAIADIQGSTLRQEYKHNDPFFGVGVRIGMTHNRGTDLGFRAEYERYDFQHQNVDMAQAGLELLFGN